MIDVLCDMVCPLTDGFEYLQKGRLIAENDLPFQGILRNAPLDLILNAGTGGYNIFDFYGFLSMHDEVMVIGGDDLLRRS